MRPVVYVETTVFSYLAARPSRDVVIAAHRRVTSDWWHNARAGFQLVASAVVLQEVAAGDPQGAAVREALLEGMPLFAVTTETETLAAASCALGTSRRRQHLMDSTWPSPRSGVRTTS
jgi:hypothetical protein